MMQVCWGDISIQVAVSSKGKGGNATTLFGLASYLY